MNQELLERTIENRRIELTEQEKKDYYPKEHIFMLLFASVAVLFCLVMAKIKGEVVEPGFVWAAIMFPVVSAVAVYITYRNKKNMLKLHYVNTALSREEQQKVLVRLSKENNWQIIKCDQRQFVADDICMRWHVRVTVIFGTPYMAYNSRCLPTAYRWHASGGRNSDNQEAICRAIEKEWMIKNKN